MDHISYTVNPYHGASGKVRVHIDLISRADNHTQWPQLAVALIRKAVFYPRPDGCRYSFGYEEDYKVYAEVIMPIAEATASFDNIFPIAEEAQAELSKVMGDAMRLRDVLRAIEEAEK